MAVTPMRRDDMPPPGSGLAARLAIRASKHRGPTSGLAPGFVQGNLAILPQALAADFLRFCQLNPKPCPLIGTSAPGDWRVPALGEDLDIRTDLPRYRVWRNGELVAEPEDIARVLARRSGELRHRLLVFLRGSADERRHRVAPHRARLQRADVPHLDCDRRGRAVPRADGGVDAADDAGRCHPRRPDHHALSGRAWRAGAYRQAGADRHHGYRQAGLRRRGARCATTSCRCSGPAG